MKVFQCSTFDLYSKGGEFIVLAKSEEEAKERLLKVLHEKYNHEPHKISVREFTKEVTLIASY